MISEHLNKNKPNKSTSTNKNTNNNERNSAVHDKVKKPLGPFFLFCKEKRSVLKKNF